MSALSFLSPAYAAFGGGNKSKGNRTPMGPPVPGQAPKGYSPFSTLNPQQGQLMDMLMQMFSGQGGQMQGPLGQFQSMLSGSPESTAAFEAPYMRQFNEQILPGIAERFSGMGSGAQSSSAFKQELGQAGGKLSENLASMKSGLQQHNMDNVMQMLQSVLGMNTMGFAPKRQPYWKEFLTALAPGLGQAAGTAAMGGF